MGNKYPYTFSPHLQLQQSLQEQPKRKSYVPLVAAQTTSSSSCPLEASSALCPDALQVPLKPKLGRRGCLPASKLENTTMESRLQLLYIFFFFFLFLTGIILENGTAQTHLALMQVVSPNLLPHLLHFSCRQIPNSRPLPIHQGYLFNPRELQ